MARLVANYVNFCDRINRLYLVVKMTVGVRRRTHEKGITGKSMCLGIDIRQSEQEVFNI